MEGVREEAKSISKCLTESQALQKQKRSGMNIDRCDNFELEGFGLSSAVTPDKDYE